jgi:hypothetical protein
LLLQLGSTAIGLKTKDGVVLAVEKRVTSPLLVLTHLLVLPFSSWFSKCWDVQLKKLNSSWPNLFNMNLPHICSIILLSWLHIYHSWS